MPKPADGEVLIKILRSGICGTDLQIYSGRQGNTWAVPPELVIGHEFAGILEWAPPGSRLTAGTLVSGEGHLMCGSCTWCRTGNRHLCGRSQLLGINRDGAFAEYLALPEANVWSYPENTDIDTIALSDPLGNAVHAAMMFPIAGQDVLITGAGPIGLMTTAIARRLGARTVVVSDPSSIRQELARGMGATAAIGPSVEAVDRACSTLEIADGFSIGFEMSGAPAALQTMISCAAPGCQIAMLGIPKTDVELNIFEIIKKMIVLRGVFGRRIFQTWQEMSGLLAAGLDIAPVVTHRFGYDEYEKAFDAAKTGTEGKVLIDWVGVESEVAERVVLGKPRKKRGRLRADGHHRR